MKERLDVKNILQFLTQYLNVTRESYIENIQSELYDWNSYISESLKGIKFRGYSTEFNYIIKQNQNKTEIFHPLFKRIEEVLNEKNPNSARCFDRNSNRDLVFCGKITNLGFITQKITNKEKEIVVRDCLDFAHLVRLYKLFEVDKTLESFNLIVGLRSEIEKYSKENNPFPARYLCFFLLRKKISIKHIKSSEILLRYVACRDKRK